MVKFLTALGFTGKALAAMQMKWNKDDVFQVCLLNI